jgi:hypothetical protein
MVDNKAIQADNNDDSRPGDLLPEPVQDGPDSRLNIQFFGKGFVTHTFQRGCWACSTGISSKNLVSPTRFRES